MYFWIPKTKREYIDWLYWFYDNKIPKGTIAKKNVKNWYFKLRLSGTVKPVHV